MGTTSEKLTYLNETKQLLKDKINNLGGSIDEHTTFRQYANQLQNVYDNLPKTEYQEGTEVNLGKTIKGKLDYDNGVVGIGQSEQYSTQGYNLLEPSFESFSSNNVTITDNHNGTYTFNGTASADTVFVFKRSWQLTSNTQYRVSGCPSNGSASTYYIYGINFSSMDKDIGNGSIATTGTSVVTLAIMIKSGVNSNGLIFKPMVVLGTTAKDFEQYSGGTPAPSPTYPYPIQCVTGNQDVVVSGKNLFSSMLEVGTFTNSGLNNTSTNRLRSKDYIAVQPNTTYTMSVTNNTTYTLTASVSFYNKNDFTTPRTGYLNWSTGNVLTFETPSDCTYIRTLFNLENSTISADRITNAMLEKGNQATTYEPYITPTSYQLSLGDKKLYEDSFISKESDGWYFNDYFREIEADEHLAWSMDSNESWAGNRFTCQNLPSLGVTTQTTFTNAYCNYAKNGNTSDYTSHLNVFLLRYINNKNRIDCMFNLASVNELKTILANNPMKIVFKGTELIKTPITDTTLINQLENWYNAKSNNGTTIITSNGNLPMIIKVRGLKGE